MKFYTHIGVLPEEKILGQDLEIDVMVESRFPFSGKDDLSETLSYVSFYEQIAAIVKDSHVDLIETLAFQIIEKIKENQPKIHSVEVHVRKLAVPIDGIFGSVEVEMKG